MKIFSVILIVLLCSGCFFTQDKENILTKRYEPGKLTEDLETFRGIVTDMHAGVYTYNTPAQINQLFDSIQSTINRSLTIREFYNKIEYIIDRLKCIHTEGYLPDDYYDSISKKPVFFPLPVVLIDGRLYVNADAGDIPLGAEIVAIDHIGSSRIINRLKMYSHTDGYSSEAKKEAIDVNFAFNFYLAYGASKEFTVNYIKDSSHNQLTKRIKGEKLDNIDKGRFFYYSDDVDYDLEIDDKHKAATITIRTFSFQSYNEEHAFNNFLNNSFRLIRQSGIKNLIIDCRNNLGGYYASSYSFLSYLVNKTLPESDSTFQRFEKLSYANYLAPEDTDRVADEDTAYYAYRKQNNGQYKLIDSNITRWEPQPDVFKGRLFVIINGRVVSAAATFTSVLRQYTNAFFVGEETGGSSAVHNASVISFVLPKTHIKVDIPLRRFYQPVKSLHANRGVIPDKIITLTKEDLINNYDGPASYIFDSIIVK